MQSVLATDGSVSFAIFIYENTTFMNLTSDFVGFWSGNGSGIALGEIEKLNIYRIDGEPSTGSTHPPTGQCTRFAHHKNRSATARCIYCFTGSCITSAAAGAVCGLNSVASACDVLTATSCQCNPGYQPQDQLVCIGT